MKHETRRKIEREAERRMASGPNTFLRENASGRNQNVVSDRLAALHARSRNDLASDAMRGAASPIGHGDIAERKRKRR